MLKQFLVPLFLLAAQAAGAQPSNGGPAVPPTPTAVPLDGGASLLLAGGLAYGLHHLCRRRTRDSSQVTDGE